MAREPPPPGGTRASDVESKSRRPALLIAVSGHSASPQQAF